MSSLSHSSEYKFFLPSPSRLTGCCGLVCYQVWLCGMSLASFARCGKRRITYETRLHHCPVRLWFLNLPPAGSLSSHHCLTRFVEEEEEGRRPGKWVLCDVYMVWLVSMGFWNIQEIFSYLLYIILPTHTRYNARKEYNTECTHLLLHVLSFSVHEAYCNTNTCCSNGHSAEYKQHYLLRLKLPSKT